MSSQVGCIQPFALPKGPYTSQVHHQFLRSIPQIAHQKETIPVILTIQTLYYRGQFPPMWAADRHLALPNGPCPHQVRHQLTKSIPPKLLTRKKDNSCDLDHTEVKFSPRLAAESHLALPEGPKLISGPPPISKVHPPKLLTRKRQFL